MIALCNAAASEALAQLHAMAFDQPWDAPAITALLATPGTFAFWDGGQGFIMARAVGEEAEILTLAVSPAARSKSLGRALVAAAAAHAATLGAGVFFLEVAETNAPALALYTGLGFLQVGRRSGYYAGGDARVLKAALPLSPAADFA